MANDPVSGADLRGDLGGPLAFRLVYDGGFFPITSITLSNVGTQEGGPDTENILRTTESQFVMTDQGYVTARAGRAPP